jgi:protein-S-isoprenylcysteine O-methyltransferase Ste14
MAYRGFSELRNFGKPTGNLDTTTSLVTSGIYKYIRHPLYGSLILFGTGCYFKNPNWLLATSLFFVSTVFFYATARAEEQENLLKFGEDYAVYIRRTKMFVPYLF